MKLNLKYNFSVIIVTYNSQNCINKCIASILSQKIKPKKIIIVDNASKDNTRTLLKQNFQGKIKLIRNSKNFGFSKACNQAIKENTQQYIVFLNPDTQIKNKDFFTRISKVIENNKNFGMLGTKVLNPDGSIQPSCGCYPTILNIILDRIPPLNEFFKTEIIRVKSYYEKEQSPDWISGTLMIINRDIFKKIGLFDENIFMYGEDVDLCFRAKKKGINILYLPKLNITHLDLGKSQERVKNKYYYMRLGFLTFFKKYKNRVNLSLLKTMFIIESLLRLALAPAKYQGKEKEQWIRIYKKTIKGIMK